MKTQIIPTEKEVKEIDWSKPQLVRSEKLIILTNGVHSGVMFCGIVLQSSSNVNVGHLESEWDKSSFTPITEPITIKFMPE